MSRFAMSIIATAPKARLWAVLSDYRGVAKYHPFVESADKLSQQDRGVGASRQCNLHGGRTAMETVTHWDEGTAMTVEVTGGSVPFKRFVATVSLRAVDSARTELSVAGDAEPKYGLLGKILFALVGRLVVKRMVRRVFKGLVYHAVTGQTVGNKVPPLPPTRRTDAAPLAAAG